MLLKVNGYCLEVSRCSKRSNLLNVRTTSNFCLTGEQGAAAEKNSSDIKTNVKNGTKLPPGVICYEFFLSLKGTYGRIGAAGLPGEPGETGNQVGPKYQIYTRFRLLFV